LPAKALTLAIRIVRLGSKRLPGEGLRIGTVRRPPRGVPKTRYASGNWYDVWFPDLSPSPKLVALARKARSDREWGVFLKRFRAELATAQTRRTLDLLAALSRVANFSVGCYCPDEARCHRSVLRALLVERGAELLGEP
jgi:uncharacterized protein YeaO (DUF488 family)